MHVIFYNGIMTKNKKILQKTIIKHVLTKFNYKF